jgi:hypothetical protein
MSEEQLYDIMCIDEDGYSITHSTRHSSHYANKEKARLSFLYPNLTYYLALSPPYEEEDDERVYNENAVDGWEDMFPDYE